MIAAACAAIAVVAAGAALRPRPAPRRPRRMRTARRRWPPRRPGRSTRSAAVAAADVAVWCEAMARVVRSGSTVATALRTTEAPIGCAVQVDQIVLALDRGSRLSDALELTTTSPHLNVALAVLRACALNGGPPAEPLDRAAATLRGRAADAAERQTQSAQARLSAIVMTVLPVAMLALLLATSSATRTATASPAGVVAVAIGGALNVGGWRWMQRIIGSAGS